jgi:hypothetical protein
MDEDAVQYSALHYKEWSHHSPLRKGRRCIGSVHTETESAPLYQTTGFRLRTFGARPRIRMVNPAKKLFGERRVHCR